ncbi:MAG: RNA methyltransferase, partial [Lachnospiraceae bacterium]|nr:RNA methyltransferase [Lachnospiraceae bacterium]
MKMVREAGLLRLLTEVYMTEEFVKENVMENAGEDLGCECFCVTEKLMKEMADTETPQGILAVCREPQHPPLDSILEKGKLRLLILEDVRDPGNLGTMIRTSEAAGIDAVIMSKGTADMYSPKVTRSTMGSIFRVPCYYTEELHSLLSRLKDAGIVTYAAHLKGEKFHNEIEYPAKCGVIIGNEANGITEETAALAGELIKIPM